MIAKLAEPLRDKRFIASFSVSLVVHAAVLIVFALIAMGVQQISEELEFDSLLSKKTKKPIEQQIKLRENERVSETLNTQAGGKVSTMTRRSSKSLSTARPLTNINKQIAMKVDSPSVNSHGIGRDDFSRDFGDDGIKGEPTAVVNGYSDALHRLTAELIRMLRNEKLLVVWLFDQSESMKDDQKEIAKNFHIVYKELGIQFKKDEGLKKKISRSKRASDLRNAIMLTTVYQYGQSIKRLLPATDDDEKIINTISEKIQIDKSGKENMCTAISRAVLENRGLAAKQKRRLVVVVVSDESGDDGAAVENTLKVVAPRRGKKSPVYVLGRESIFGYPYARHRWKDPKYGLWHWLRINRGPETAFAECLQWDGLHARWDSFSAHFGPYEQVRIARESNGIFFMLPSEEANLAGAGARMKRQFKKDDMREYHPLWLSRQKYAAERKRSKFRETIWRVVVVMNPTKHEELLIPNHDPKLNIRQRHYPIELAKFKEVARKEALKAYVAWSKLGTAIQMLNSVETLRSREESTRWRANFDLMKAQCLAYRVRLFQFMLVMDAHVNASPPRKAKPRQPEPYNEWWFRRDRNMIVPDEAQFSRVKAAFKSKMSREEFLEFLKKDQDAATEMFQRVIASHKGTPWAQRAEWELRNGFGMRLDEVYWNPKYNRRDIKIPKF